MKIGEVISDGLNVRENPHQDSEVVDVLAKGDEMTVLDHKAFGNFVWLKVRTRRDKDSVIGWVYAPYVSVKSEIPDVPHIPVPDEAGSGVLKIVSWVAIAVVVLLTLTMCGG